MGNNKIYEINQVFIVFDSLRYDVFQMADVPFLKSLGEWKKAYSPGTYTLPAHTSFFVGKLPQLFDRTDYYDTVARRFNGEEIEPQKRQLWRLNNLEDPKQGLYTLDGKNIIDGFRKRGYKTIGTGSVNWFNPRLKGAKYLINEFEYYRYFGNSNDFENCNAEDQLSWSIEEIRKSKNKPYFTFINLGETHNKFIYKGCGWEKDDSPYGNKELSIKKQKLCLEYLDKLLFKFFKEIDNFNLVLCADHGEAFGENDVWGHGINHKHVIEVPLLIKINNLIKGVIK